MTEINNGPEKRKLYSGISIFGVPYADIDIRYAAECLFDIYSNEGKDVHKAMNSILEQNERVVSRCRMLISFSGILIALFLFVANKPDVLSNAWQKWVFYCIMLLWVVSTLNLLWSLKHKFPATWDFMQKQDFILTAELFLRRMGNYNVALMAAIFSFLTIAFVLSPISAVISDKIFK